MCPPMITILCCNKFNPMNWASICFPIQPSKLGILVAIHSKGILKEWEVHQAEDFLPSCGKSPTAPLSIGGTMMPLEPRSEWPWSHQWNSPTKSCKHVRSPPWNILWWWAIPRAPVDEAAHPSVRTCFSPMERYYSFRVRESLNHTGAHFFLTKREMEVFRMQLVVGHCNEDRRQLCILQKAHFCLFHTFFDQQPDEGLQLPEGLQTLKPKMITHMQR